MSLFRFSACAGLASVLLAAPAAPAAPAASQTPGDFKGETVAIQIGYGPGGGYDTYGRALARHYGRFIPGNPTIAKNMPGAGSLRAANHVYNLSAKESTEIALFSASTAMEPMMGNDREFLADAQKMNLDLDIATAEQVEELLRQFANYPTTVIEKAKAAIGR